VRIYEFLNFPSTEKKLIDWSMTMWTGGTLGSTVDRGWCGHLVRQCLAGARVAGAGGHQSSPTVVEEDEQYEAVPEGYSLEQGLWW
jgi:hypothetical protein